MGNWRHGWRHDRALKFLAIKSSFGTTWKLKIVWQNTKLDAVPFTFTLFWHVPYHGILEVDFVDIRKPSSSATAISNEDFRDLVTVLDLWDQLERSLLLELNVVSLRNKLMILQ